MKMIADMSVRDNFLNTTITIFLYQNASGDFIFGHTIDDSTCSTKYKTFDEAMYEYINAQEALIDYQDELTEEDYQ